MEGFRDYLRLCVMRMRASTSTESVTEFLNALDDYIDERIEEKLQEQNHGR